MTKAFVTVRVPSMKIKKISETAFQVKGSTNLNWNNLCIARLLVNVNQRHQFDEDPRK